MKPGKILFALLALLFFVVSNSYSEPKGEDAPQKLPITLLTSPEMLDITTLWVDKYNGAHPDAQISILQMPTGESKELMSLHGTIGLVTKEELPGIVKDKSCVLTVGKDVIVPVMSAKNPNRAEILQKGISPEAFSLAFTSAGKVTWGSLLGNDNQNSVTPFVYGDRHVSSYLADFLKTDPGQINAALVEGVDEMVKRFRKDQYAIGFCRVTDVTNPEGKEMIPGLNLVPIDMNGNHTIDHFENIYDTPEDLQRAVWIGKYPKTLYSKCYAVTNPRPLEQEETAFLNWLVSDGQDLLTANGYSAITRSELYANEEKLAGNQITVIDVPVAGSFDKTALIVLGSLLALFCIIFIVRISTRRGEPGSGSENHVPEPFSEESAIQVPSGLFFDKSHTWAFMEKDGKVRIGIDDFLQQITGPISRVIMKQPGDHIKKGELFLTLVQNGKQMKIKSPVSGVVNEHNSGLVSDSSSLNSAPFFDGWVYLVEPLNWSKELKAFVMVDRYVDWIKAEMQRLKDYLSSGISIPGRIEAGPILQDGGELEKGFLESFGPEAWEEFQNGFINTSKI